MSEEVIIEIRELVKYYKDKIDPALDNLSLKIYKGEIFGLLGPNGAGKTTTISIISNLLKATSGDIRVNGLSTNGSMMAIKSQIGIVGQDIALYPQLTAYENLMFFGGFYKLGRKELKQRIDELLECVGLIPYKDKQVRTFSGGMKRRLNLLAGVVHCPELLILDEPTVGIDVHSRNRVIEFLRESNEKGMTILYTSHFLEEAEKLCSRVCVIDYGKLVLKGTPEELKKEYGCESLEEVFMKVTGYKLRDSYE